MGSTLKTSDNRIAEEGHALRHLAASDLLGIFYWRIDGGIYDANDTFLQMVGYSRDDIDAGRLNWVSITAPEYREQTIQDTGTLHQQGISPHREREYIHKDGHRIPVVVGAVTLNDEQNEGVAFTLDVTEGKEKAEELRFVTTHARCLLWYGTVTYQPGSGYNYAFRTRVFDEEQAQSFCPLEMQPGEVYTQAWYRHRLPAGQVSTSAISTEAFKNNDREYRTEFGARNLHGEIQWFDEKVYLEPLTPTEAGLPRWRVVGVCADITERRQAEERLQSALEKEKWIAQTLQRSLLQIPPSDTFPGLSVAAQYDPARNETLLGGDFVDIFAVSKETVALIVGDATGKGMEAAAYTAQVKFALRAFLREKSNPTDALERLNRFILDAARFDWEQKEITYVVASIATLNTRTGELTVSSAGMEPPFVLSADTGEISLLREGGLMLGVMPEATYTADRTILRQDDLLVITTDGLTEPHRDGQFFGYDGIVAAVRAAVARGNTPQEIGKSVVDQARAFLGGPFPDDICILIARRKAS